MARLLLGGDAASTIDTVLSWVRDWAWARPVRPAITIQRACGCGMAMRPCTCTLHLLTDPLVPLSPATLALAYPSWQECAVLFMGFVLITLAWEFGTALLAYLTVRLSGRKAIWLQRIKVGQPIAGCAAQQTADTSLLSRQWTADSAQLTADN